MRGKWIAVALVVLGVSAALVGLGLQKGVGPVASAATKSENAGGAKVAFTVGVESPKGSFTVSANGVVDKGQADITADLSQVLAAGGLPAGTARSSSATSRRAATPFSTSTRRRWRR